MAAYVRNLPGFAGVALADILANSVAIVIIMIVVTLLVRYQEEQEKLEQAEEVSVLLSRELSSSLVMSRLPTSPPAQLHDYDTSPLDRNPQHAIMPIIELHGEFIRDYYTGAVWRRDQLLLQDNDFDRYIDSLAPQQLAAMRIDIYSIRLFYVTMSILKAHQHKPRHWHFLGYAGGGRGAGVNSDVLKALRDEHQSDNADEWLGGEQRGGRRQGGDGGAPAALPGDVTPGAVMGGTDNYPLGAGASGQSSGAILQQMLDLPPTDMGAAAPGNGQTTGNQRSNAPPSPPPSRRFRAADPSTAGAGEMQALDWDIENYYDLLHALFSFMRDVQQDADRNLPSALANYDFIRDVFNVMRQSTAAPLSIQETTLLVGLEAMFSIPPPANGDDSLPLEIVADAALPGQWLALPVNQRIERALWHRDALQPPLEPPPAAAELSLHLGLHAEIYRGLRAPVAQNSVLLMPLPAQAPDPQPRWRVVTLVSPLADDFITGFLYAAIDSQGRLLLPVDENAVEIDHLRVTSHIPGSPFRHEWWRLFFYSLIVTLIAVAALINYRKRA